MQAEHAGRNFRAAEEKNPGKEGSVSDHPADGRRCSTARMRANLEMAEKLEYEMATVPKWKMCLMLREIIRLRERIAEMGGETYEVPE